MQQIEVVLQPECVGGVSEALRKAKIGPFRTSDVTIFDPAAPPDGSYRGTRYAIGRSRIKLELIVPDHEVEPAVEAIRDGIDAFGEGSAELVVLAVQDSVHISASPWMRRRPRGAVS
jgi:nitrogen regulatory protein P-II 1